MSLFSVFLVCPSPRAILPALTVYLFIYFVAIEEIAFKTEFFQSHGSLKKKIICMSSHKFHKKILCLL